MPIESERSERTAAGPPAPAPFRLGYRPGLDGLRGVAVLAVVLYHAGLGRASGGFLGVSTFFTLSGFLITTVLLGERSATGRISLTRFWSRRLRRLLPAALVAIAGTVLAGAALADSTQLARMRGDAIASLLYVANWRFVGLGDTYGSLFSTPSPFVHFWSLSIEEQFYVGFPLLLLGVIAVARGRGRVIVAALAVVALASVVWSIVLVRGGAPTDRVYFGTDTRAAELLAGAVLAAWWGQGPARLSDAVRRLVRAAGAVALVVMVVLWTTVTLDQRLLYQGGLALTSLLTLAVLAAVIEGGLVDRVLSARPLVALGVVSYGVYLFHWPILVWLDVHTGLPPLGRLAVALPVATALAALSYRYLERPIRDGRRVVAPTARWAVPVSMAATLALVVAVSAWRPADEGYDFAAALDAAERTGTVGATGPDQQDVDRFVELSELRARLEATGAPTVASFGDSTALVNGLALSTWAETTFADTGEATLVPVEGWAQLGCGLVDDGVRRQAGRWVEAPEECHEWWDGWAAAAAGSSPQVAVVMLGAWDVLDLRPAGFDEEAAVGDPRIDDLLRRRIDRGIDALAPHTDLVVFALSPPVEIGRVDGRSPDRARPENDPARMRRFNELVQEAADDRPDVATVDLAAWVADQGDDRELRPDGVHLDEEAARDAAAWMGPELARLHAEWEAQR